MLQQNDSPNITGGKIINTALCAFGMSGLVFHAPFLTANPGFNLYGVWERSEKKAAGIYPYIKSFDSLESMLADDAIDLVIVNTPNYTHYEFAKQSLLAGKHVLVEKSFTVTVSEAKELISIAAEKQRKLSVFQNRRFDSDFKTVKKVVEENLPGNIVEAEFHFDRFKPAMSPKLHKETPLPGSGLLHDLGPHLIDQALFLFGMPQQVTAQIRYVRSHTQVNDYFDIILHYASLSLRLKASLLVRELLPAYILHGEKGSFVKMRADVQEDILKTGEKPGNPGWGIEPSCCEGILHIENNGSPLRNSIPTLPGNYMEFFNQLYHAIVWDQPLPVTANDGLNVMIIIEAALASDKSKSTVHLSTSPE